MTDVRRTARHCAAILMTTLLPACAGRSAEPEVPAPPGPIAVTVLNQTDGAVTVGASWDGGEAGQRHTVAANAETAYEMPYDARMLRFMVEVGGATVRTNPIEARPADRLRITVSPPARVVIDRIGGGGGD